MSTLIKLLFIGILLFVLTMGACGQDTIRITMVYEDTTCKFEGEDVQTLYNSGCLYRDEGYIVYSTYFHPKFLYSSRKRLPAKYIVWYYIIK